MNSEFRVYAAKRYMNYVRSIKNTLRQLEEEISNTRDDMTSISGLKYTDMPGNPNAYGDAIPDMIARMEDKVRAYMTELAEWIDVESEAHKAISEIEDGRYRELLWSHYVARKSWEQIAVDMSYSYEYVRKELFENSLDALYFTMPEQWRRNFPKAEN